MFDFERLSQLIQAGQFETVIDILQPISLARTSLAISLSEEDKQKLLGLLIPLHEYSMTLPENSPEFERLHQEESQARAAAVAHISPFDLLQEGAPNLSLPVPVS